MRSLSRWISLFIVVAMIMTFFPIAVFAAPSDVLLTKCEDDESRSEEIITLFNSDIKVASTEATVYDIKVDGVHGIVFSSDEDASGENWYYDSENGWLVLEDYHGKDISVDGDLKIYSYGESVISGDGWYGISSSGSIELYCMSGSLSIYGDEQSYDAVRAMEDVFCSPLADTVITLVGGQCSDDDYYGGNAIYASRVFFTMEGHVNAFGGEAISPSKFGGYSIIANEIHLYADCTLKAGDGPYISEAIYTKELCEIGRINAKFSASGAGHSAFAGTGDVIRRYVDYTRTEDYSEWVFTPYEYTIAFHGAGGTLDGQSSVVIDAPFDIGSKPEAVDLTDYIFTRLGYRQSGWLGNNGTLIPIDALCKPNFHTTEPDSIDLTAVWESVGPEVVTEEDKIVAAIPNDWCEEKAVNIIVLAVYNQNGKMLASKSAEWTAGQDIIIELMMEKKSGMTYGLFFLDNEFAPVSDVLKGAIE